MEELKQTVAELVEFKNKISIFMNMDYIALTTQAQSLDEFLRKKVE